MLFHHNVSYEVARKGPEDGIPIENFHPLTYNNIAKAHRQLGLIQEAEKIENRINDFGETNKMAYCNKGMELAKMKRYDAAKKMFEHALTLDPTYEPALKGLKRIQNLHK